MLLFDGAGALGTSICAIVPLAAEIRLESGWPPIRAARKLDMEAPAKLGSLSCERFGEFQLLSSGRCVCIC